MASPEVVYLNGEFVPHSEARVSVEDRGFNFADGIYEVVRIVGGRGFRIEAHLDRFQSGAQALEIELALSRDAVREAMLETARANGVEEGTVYMQLTRGAAPRSHSFPEGVRPTLVMLSRPFAGPSTASLENGVSVITAPDLRWGYCEVKTIGLLPNVIAQQRAKSEGCYEALLVRAGRITEGTHSSVFCVRDGVVYTHPIENLLPSITRRFLINAYQEKGVQVEEVARTVEEFRSADEVFLTGTTTEVMAVTRIDRAKVGTGKPGEVTGLGMELYRRDLEAVRMGGAG